jgi:hypothetical protein
LEPVIERLLKSDVPSVRFKVSVNVLGKKRQSTEIKELRQQVKSSTLARLLLSERDGEGRIPYHPYAKWYGAHWVLADLADIGYPPGDESLVPLREQVYSWLLSKHHESRIKSIQGRVRRHASQEANAVYSLITLGIADDRTDELAARLMKWQWPDGGWNCDRNPGATNSSFMESLIPLRAMALYSEATGNKKAKETARETAEIFLKRRMYRTQKDGGIISSDFVALHYPCYWHYDILFGLKVLAEAGFIDDRRCRDALDLLESKRLPDGGFPAERKYYRVGGKPKAGRSVADWGGTSSKKMNEFITADALFVLKTSRRLK